MNFAWKRDERKVCRWFGCERHGPMQELNDDDGTHEYLHIQVKRRKSHAILREWDRAKEFTSKTGKVPVVALTEHNRPGFWILCHSGDLQAVAAARKAVRDIEHNMPLSEREGT